MEGFAVVCALHALAIVPWIGGVALVTKVLLPAARALPDAGRRIEWFAQARRRLAGQARIATPIAGAVAGGHGAVG